eukprot:1363081-Rhodomonas_salina.2
MPRPVSSWFCVVEHLDRPRCDAGTASDPRGNSRRVRLAATVVAGQSLWPVVRHGQRKRAQLCQRAATGARGERNSELRGSERERNAVR